MRLRFLGHLKIFVAFCLFLQSVIFNSEVLVKGKCVMDLQNDRVPRPEKGEDGYWLGEQGQVG